MNKVFSEIDQSSERKRYEIKLVYDGLNLDEVASWIHSHPFLFKREYPPRQVNNIYFDTAEMNLRYDHLQGIFSRFKLRFRWYHDTWLIKNGILELKQKSGRLGHKVSFQINNGINLSELTWRQIQDRIRSELTPQWNNLFAFTHPVLINRYLREYFIDAEGLIRITLDARQRAYYQGFRHKPNLSVQTPMRNTVVLEVKARKSYHQQVADVLAGFPLYSSAHSKYLEGTENLF